MMGAHRSACSTHDGGLVALTTFPFGESQDEVTGCIVTVNEDKVCNPRLCLKAQLRLYSPMVVIAGDLSADGGALFRSNMKHSVIAGTGTAETDLGG